MRTRNPELDQIADRAGIHFLPGAVDYLPRLPARDKQGKAMDGKWGEFDMPNVSLAFDEMMASDAATATTYAQPTLVTQPSGGILSLMTTYVDPKLIEVLLSPTKAEEVYGVRKLGDWTTQTAAFSLVENTGEVASYGDFNESGRADANVNWPQRQSYLFQTFTEYGDLEAERMGLAKVNWVAQKNISSANILNEFQNLTYFFGVSGLNNYGGLNDPGLSPALTPGTKVAGGTSWQNALPTEIVTDVQSMFTSLQQATHGTGGNLDLDAPLTLALSPISEVYLMNPNTYGLMAIGMLKVIFKNLRVVSAVQYQSGTTYSAQLIADEIKGQKTTQCAFNEKMRAHRIVPDTSSFRQKKSAGSWGAIVYRPIGVAEMSGI